jgi:hypothetical protein
MTTTIHNSPEFQQMVQQSGKSKGFIYVLICNPRVHMPTVTITSSDKRHMRFIQFIHRVPTGCCKEPTFTMT